MQCISALFLYTFFASVLTFWRNIKYLRDVRTRLDKKSTKQNRLLIQNVGIVVVRLLAPTSFEAPNVYTRTQ